MDLRNERLCSIDELIPLIREQLAAGQRVCFSPRGTSMLPMLRQEKDRVELSLLTEPPKKYDVLLYQSANGNYILHRAVSVGDTVICIGDNQFLREAGIRREQIIGVVSGFYRGERYWSVRQWDYRLYCRLWHFSRPLRHFWQRGWGWLKRKLK